MGGLLAQTIDHFFPDLKKQLSEIHDPRVRIGIYSIGDIIFAGIAMFLFKRPSRNQMNNSCRDKNVKSNAHYLFGFNLPHMDTVDDVLKKLSDDQLEGIQRKMVQKLIENKILQKNRFMGKYVRFAIDVTGVCTVSKADEGTISKESKNGVVTHMRQVIEAKFIIPGGWAISICSEWLSTEKNDAGDKEDCEINAFKRLAVKLKTLYPKLPICILVDGLYASDPFFTICRDNDWRFCAVLKDKKLSTIWDKIDEELIRAEEQNKVENIILDDDMTIEWMNGLSYRDHKLTWIEAIPKVKIKEQHFVFISDIPAFQDNVRDIVATGRSRWHLEDAFNCQKNRGYELKHKFSRGSFIATKNYYLLMQIAHMLNQLLEYSQHIKKLRDHSKETLLHLWDIILMALQFIEDSLQFKYVEKRTQYRYAFE